MALLIYKITNKVNQKKYIGKTKNLKARIYAHLNQSGCRLLARAIKKYGWENFSLEIMEDELQEQEASAKEGDYILSENSLSPDGYNLTLDTSQGRDPSLETRLKNSASQQKLKRFGYNTKSGFTGVKKSRGGFAVRVNLVGQAYYNSYPTAEEAASAYDKMNLFLRNGNCSLNFPEKLEEYLKEDLKLFYDSFTQKKPQTSRHVGVSLKKTGKWSAYYNENKKQIHLGTFNTEKEACEAYETARLFRQQKK